MVYKIAANEWLKRVDNMSEAEKENLARHVNDWLHDKAPILLPRANDSMARMMNVEQVSGSWTTDEQDAFSYGVRLMTPFAGCADTWLPDMIYNKAAKRAIHRIVDILTQQLPTVAVKPKSVPDIVPTPKPHNRTTAKLGNGGTVGAPLVGAQPHNRTTAKLIPLSAEPGTIVPRPAHIDQYVHLLPESTQKKAMGYGQLMKDLGTARTNMRLLIDDPKATAAEREKWAKTAVAIDKRIADVRLELDREWEKVVDDGHVVLDDFGVAHIIDPTTGKVNDPNPKMSVSESSKNETLPKVPKKKRAPRKQYTEEEKAARIKYLQKWLRDPRPAATPEHKKQWQENAKELLDLGGEISDSMIKAAEHYGARVPKKK